MLGYPPPPGAEQTPLPREQSRHPPGPDPPVADPLMGADTPSGSRHPLGADIPHPLGADTPLGADNPWDQKPPSPAQCMLGDTVNKWAVRILLEYNLSGGSRISLRREYQLPSGVANIRFCQNFPKNCMKLKEFGPPGGGGTRYVTDPRLNLVGKIFPNKIHATRSA